jgi:2,3-bisphosphoglycerate-independent phosphoglycerate mutase
MVWRIIRLKNWKDARRSRSPILRIWTVSFVRVPSEWFVRFRSGWRRGVNLLGYDVTKYYTGRAPLEAASRNIEVANGEVAFRCNLVTVIDGEMIDYSADHITSEEAAELISAVDRDLGDESFKFHAGVSYRHLLIARGKAGEDWDRGLACTPPHDIIGQPIADHLPTGEGEILLNRLMQRSVEVLSDHPVNRRRRKSGKKPATMIWLWGQGKRPSMPTFLELYGMTGSVISAVDLIRGMGRYAGLSIIEVPGATGYYDTNYAGKASYGLDALSHGDFLFVHVESPDEAGHAGDIDEKIRAIECFDKLVVGPIVEGISHFEPHRVMVLPDHLTPIKVRTHVADPVPYAVCGTDVPCGRASVFSEAEALKEGGILEDAFALLPSYLTG